MLLVGEFMRFGELCVDQLEMITMVQDTPFPVAVAVGNESGSKYATHNPSVLPPRRVWTSCVRVLRFVREIANYATSQRRSSGSRPVFCR